MLTVLTLYSNWLLAFFWLAIVLLTVYVEAHTVQLVSIWFACAAVVSGILAACKVDFTIQLLVFAILSFILVLASRPLAKKLNRAKSIKTNADELIDEVAFVTKKIDAFGKGEVKTKYETYTAIAKDPTKQIAQGTKVKVLEITGNKIIVEEI